MQLEHRFTVPVPPDVAWEALLDPERVAPCFPGATLQSVEGQQFTGTVKVRLGPIALLYKGKGTFTQTDPQARRTVIEASGRDSRGNGTATANVAVQVRPDDDGATVELATALTITGRPAQLGRGLIAEVSGKIVSAFAKCLAERLTGQPGSTERPGASSPSAGSETNLPEINLIQVGGPSMLKRIVPTVLGAIVVVLVLRRLLKRG
jgi:carbon monoxide dehydrogenase subunit G